MLRSAGAWPTTAVIAVTVATSLVPAATALSLALLVGRLVAAVTDGAEVLSALALPLALLAGVMLAGHLLDAVREPLHYLIVSRVDGACRAELSRLASTSPTIAALERPQTQSLVDLARADPQNWTERTPGMGAVALVVILGRASTLASTSLILVACAWWLVPLLVVPAAIVHRLSNNDVSVWFDLWRAARPEIRRRRVWSEANVDPGPAKELRIFGLGEYAVARQLHHVLTAYRPIWAHQNAALVRHWRRGLLVFGPLATAMLAIAHLAATGRTSVAVATAAISASTAVYRAFSGDPRDVLGAATMLDAFDELRTQLAAPETAAAPDAATPAPPATAVAPAVRLPKQDVRSRPPGGVIRFEDVSFAYPGTDRLVIDRLNLEIRPNELLAIVGLNGAGKSTLIKLIAGLYIPPAVDAAAGPGRLGRPRSCLAFVWRCPTHPAGSPHFHSPFATASHPYYQPSRPLPSPLALFPYPLPRFDHGQVGSAQPRRGTAMAISFICFAPVRPRSGGPSSTPARSVWGRRVLRGLVHRGSVDVTRKFYSAHGPLWTGTTPRPVPILLAAVLRLLGKLTQADM